MAKSTSRQEYERHRDTFEEICEGFGDKCDEIIAYVDAVPVDRWVLCFMVIPAFGWVRNNISGKLLS